MSTLSFETFWSWLQQHPNCVLSAGTAEAMLYDDDQLHWYIGPDQTRLVVQLIHGKRLVGEVVIDLERITYVQVLGEERPSEFIFEAVYESPTDRVATYVFVVSHGMEDAAQLTHGPAVH